MPDSIEELERTTRRLATDPRVRLVYVFGSAARPGSVAPRDLDIALLTRPALRLEELLRIQGDLQQELSIPLDLVSLNDARIVLAHEIVEGGRCLYARSPEDETELVTRTRMRWWDWLPMREAQWRATGERVEARLGPQA